MSIRYPGFAPILFATALPAFDPPTDAAGPALQVRIHWNRLPRRLPRSSQTEAPREE
jgi:hypothetical protein